MSLSQAVSNEAPDEKVSSGPSVLFPLGLLAIAMLIVYLSSAFHMTSFDVATIGP